MTTSMEYAPLRKTPTVFMAPVDEDFLRLLEEDALSMALSSLLRPLVSFWKISEAIG